MPNRRKNVPYSGPLAPPTLVTSVMPTDLNSSAMFAAFSASSFAPTAAIPRAMFAPWSASPITESSSVSSVWCSSARARNRRSQSVS